MNSCRWSSLVQTNNKQTDNTGYRRINWRFNRSSTINNELLLKWVVLLADRLLRASERTVGRELGWVNVVSDAWDKHCHRDQLLLTSRTDVLFPKADMTCALQMESLLKSFHRNRYQWNWHFPVLHACTGIQIQIDFDIGEAILNRDQCCETNNSHLLLNSTSNRYQTWQGNTLPGPRPRNRSNFLPARWRRTQASLKWPFSLVVSLSIIK